MKNIISILILILSIISCGSIAKKTLTEPQKMSLQNSKWGLENSKAEITLELIQNKISGFAGCNNYFSNDVKIDNNLGTIKINSIGSTRAMCKDISEENNYLQLLNKVTNYKINDNILELYSDKILLLRYIKK